ncbi:MAG: hypothetical protein ACD_11C00133G0010 [uncultured bacterium]|nr:MAG: hypothetical protein ACD_11C00133G0010 [uncultured bacterium]
MKKSQKARIASGFNALASVWLIVSSNFWVVAEDIAAKNSFTIGILILFFSITRTFFPKKMCGLSWINMIFGLWLIFSPFIFDYEIPETIINSIIVGLVIFIFATGSSIFTPVKIDRDNRDI